VSGSRFKGPAAKLALLVSTLLIFLLVAEIGVRVITDMPGAKVAHDPVLGKISRPAFGAWRFWATR